MNTELVQPQTSTSLGTDGDFCHQGQDTEIAKQTSRLLKPTDMTIHWKALEEHFLMVPLVFRCNLKATHIPRQHYKERSFLFA
jgi:hypothetical protein